ncbi:hypothetical protein Tco_0955047 [Tanacetum coccineum]|uniref:Uncharacterized protein n=1 Tax=Tanacetum coccineum TaxID=301880 RepID=A0ABQ5E647_9ASTR
MKAFKESKNTNKRQPDTRGSSEGTGTIPGVSDESTVVSTTSNEGTGTKPRVPGKEKVITKEKVILEWGSEQESEYSEEDQLDEEEKDDKEGDADDEGDDHISDSQDSNDEDDETESDEDEIYKYKIRVRKDEDEEMLNAEVEDSEKKVMQKYLMRPRQTLKRLKKQRMIPKIDTVKDTTDAEISSLLDIKIQSYLILRRTEERSINNNSFLGEYEYSSLALDRDERGDEKKRLDHLKQDQNFYGGEEDEKDLVEMGEVGGGPFGEGEGEDLLEDDMRVMKRSEKFRIEDLNMCEPEAEAATVGTGRLVPLTRLFTNTQFWTGSSSSSAADGHDPEDLTPSHIRSDLDALHRRVRQIEEDDVRAENNQLRMMLDCSENRTMALPQFEGALMVPVTHDDPRDPYVASRDAATAPATDNDDPATREETSPSKPQGSPPRDS